MAATPKPVRKAIKSAQSKYRKEIREEPKTASSFMKGKKGAQSVAKRSIKHMSSEGHVSKKGKIPSHMRSGEISIKKVPGKYKK